MREVFLRTCRRPEEMIGNPGKKNTGHEGEVKSKSSPLARQWRNCKGVVTGGNRKKKENRLKLTVPREGGRNMS